MARDPRPPRRSSIPPARPFAVDAEPPRSRPDTPNAAYGVPTRGGEYVDWQHVVDRLDQASAYWLTRVTPGGRPHGVPAWGVIVDGDLYLEAGAADTAKRRNLAASPEALVHLDGAEDVVIVRGLARGVLPAPDLGAGLAAAFTAKYRGYQPTPRSWDDGSLVRIDPRTVLAWRDMPTVTRWRIGPPSPDAGAGGMDSG